MAIFPMLRDAQSDAIRRKLNDEANRKLAAEARLRDLSIVGAGQAEGKNGNLTVNRKESSTVQPVG